MFTLWRAVLVTPRWRVKYVLPYPYNWSLSVGYLNHGNWINDTSTIDLLQPCRQFLDTMEILKQFVFLYGVLAIHKSCKNCRRKCSRKFPDVRLPKITTVFKHLKRIRARDCLLERKGAPRRQVLPQKKLEKVGARYSLARLAQLTGLSATPGRITIKLMNITQLWFTNLTTQTAEWGCN